MMNESFWRDRRVFITGHTGFKGSWLSLWLHSLGAQVTGYALDPPTSPSLFEAAAVSGLVRSIHGDVRDAAALTRALRESRGEVVFHLAAQALVRRSYAEPVETFSTNVVGTACLLDAVRQAPDVRAVVIVTTDKCYENREWPWPYRESDTLGGRDPYASSKACAELVTSAYRDSFFNPSSYASHGVAVASARAGNVIGGGDWATDRLVPDLVAGFARGDAVRIRNPDAVRPWQHVLEPLSGYLVLAERLIAEGPAFGEAWNFGPDNVDACEVSAVADMLAEAWGAGARWEVEDVPKPHEAGTLRLDYAKARHRLGWQPRWRLPQAVRDTVAWYREFDAAAPPPAARNASLRSIRTFSETTPHAGAP